MPEKSAFRSLVSYMKQHSTIFAVLRVQPRTLTEARRLAFGVKRSMHGLNGKAVALK